MGNVVKVSPAGAGGLIPVYFANSGVLTNAVQTIKASMPGAFYGFQYFSDNAAKGYIQLFDVALLASITLGTTVPNYTITVPPYGYDKVWQHPIEFKNGLHAAFTTSKTNATAMTTGLDALAFYLPARVA